MTLALPLGIASILLVFGLAAWIISLSPEG